MFTVKDKRMSKRSFLLKIYNIDEVVSSIQEIAREFSNHPVILEIAIAALESSNPARYIYEYAYNSAVFRTDLTDDQNIRTPLRLLKDQEANCVDYTCFMSACLTAANIPHKYRVAAVNDKYLNHIYLIINNLAADPVIGQAQDGSDSFSNRPGPIFYGLENKFEFKQDYNMDLYRLNGYKRKVINNGIIGNVYSGLNGGLIQRRYSAESKGSLYNINLEEGVLKNDIGVAPTTSPTPPTTGSNLLTPMLIIGGALAIKLLIK
jgi:hypothetical protein